MKGEIKLKSQKETASKKRLVSRIPGTVNGSTKVASKKGKKAYDRKQKPEDW